MFNPYVKNRGLTQTIVNNSDNKNHFNEMIWDSNYNGDIANISIATNTDGDTKKYNLRLDNEDLADMLNIYSVNIPIDKRLKMNLERSSCRHDPVYKIELPNIMHDYKPQEYENITKILESPKRINYLSSPLPNEELIIPITIGDKNASRKYSSRKYSSRKYSLTPNKRRKYKKSHKTYKVYKKLKSFNRKSKSHSANSKKSRRNSV